MSQVNLSLIVAMTKNRVIGYKNTLPWRLPSDLQRFKKITTRERVLIMGRKTHDSIIARNGTTLPGRFHIVLSRQPLRNSPLVRFVSSVEEALQEVPTKACVIGGEEVYRLFLPYVTRAYVTTIDASIINGDAIFPDVDWSTWRRTSWSCLELRNEKDQFLTSYATYERKLPS